MTLNVIYIEDDPTHFALLKKAVEIRNQDVPQSAQVILLHAEQPNALVNKLTQSTDVVIADVYYKNVSPEDNHNQLVNIIEIIHNWENKIHRGRHLPIIALTGKGIKYIEFCLNHKEDLFDIWDKGAASPEYRAWRLSQLASELPRIRPDALIQSLIMQMSSSASWHNNVIEMLRRYDSGITEADQLERAGEAVLYIGDMLGSRDLCKQAWTTIVSSEPLMHATNKSIRGHARHALNVFWMGYYLLNHPVLQQWVKDRWKQIIEERSGMRNVANIEPLEALCDAWFYASIFHDFASLIERSDQVQKYHFEVMKNFGNLANNSLKLQNFHSDDVVSQLSQFLNKEFDEPWNNNLEQAFSNSLHRDVPDHGLLSALYFYGNRPTNKQQGPLIREAVRAMALHNIICELKRMNNIADLLSWQREPLACLLLLCDQLQTWDRERHDVTYRNDIPERAELSQLKVIENNYKPRIQIAIDYIAPSHLEGSPDIFGRVKDDLDRILAENPKSILGCLSQDWPFHLDVTCTMSGINMNTKMSFPEV